jgi:hypothetical protein
MFSFACAGGLIATGNLSQIAKSLHVSDAQVWGLAIVPLAATLTSLCNAVSRVVHLLVHISGKGSVVTDQPGKSVEENVRAQSDPQKQVGDLIFLDHNDDRISLAG